MHPHKPTSEDISASRGTGVSLRALALSTRGVVAAPLEELFHAADGFRKKERKPSSAQKSVALCFYEASTRTRFSFEMAARLAGIYCSSFQAEGSSAAKGETLLDTGRTLAAMGFDAMVLRHSDGGAARLWAEHLPIPIINAGDGMAEHPTQALLDWFTLWRRFQRLQGLRILIVGDIAHSRVVRSHLHGVGLGLRFRACASAELLPPAADQLFEKRYAHLDEALEEGDFDACIAIRPQLERFRANEGFSESAYRDRFLVDLPRLRRFPEGAVFLSPGPALIGVDATEEVLRDRSVSLVDDQVSNGVFVRAALLDELLAEEPRAKPRRKP